MPPSPLVSIVMPSLNNVSFISQSIDSVLNQNYANIELIVADGASDDGTVELLRQRSEEDPRLRWFSCQDSGPAEAINNALAKARGTIIGWLNSDDLYTPGAIARALDAFAMNPDWIMVYGRGEHIDVHGNFINTYPTLPPSTPIERFAAGSFICQPTVFFKITMPMMLGGLDTSLKAAFDFDYWLRAFLAFPERIGFINEVQAQSRLHEACITKKMRQTVALEGVEVISRYLGKAPVHWLTTCIEEMLAASSGSEDGAKLKKQILDILDKAEGKVCRDDLEGLREKIIADARFGSALPPPIVPSKNR